MFWNYKEAASGRFSNESLPKEGKVLLGIFLALVFCSAPLLAQRGFLVKAVNLAEMETEAAIILKGRITDVRVEPHPEFNNLRTAVITVQVQKVFKGELVTTYTWREYLQDIRDNASNLMYKPGQEYLLLLIRPSRYGLSSPAGQSQGVFRVRRDAQGNQFVVNGRNNVGLFKDMEVQAPQINEQLSVSALQMVSTHRRGALPMGSVVEVVKALSARKSRRQLRGVE